MLLRLAAIAQTGRTDAFLLELAVDEQLGEETKSALREIAGDSTFLDAVQDYFRHTRTLH